VPDVPVVPLALLVAFAVLVAALFTVRRFLISGTVGSFDCSLRRSGASGWTVGVARYGQGRLDWFRIFSLSPRPSRAWPQSALSVVGQRHADGGEVFAVLPGALVVQCRVGDDDMELAMSQDAYVGFTSWIEAAPPGQRGSVT
jgi:hypothetical protein